MATEAQGQVLTALIRAIAVSSQKYIPVEHRDRFHYHCFDDNNLSIAHLSGMLASHGAGLDQVATVHAV